MRELLFLKKYIIRYKGTYLLFTLFFLLSSIITIIIPKLVGNFTDMLQLKTQADQQFHILILHIFMAGAVLMGAKFSYRHFLSRGQAMVINDINNDLYNHIQTLPHSFFQKNNTGNLMSHFTNDSNTIRHLVEQGPVVFITIFFTGTLTLIILCSINLQLTVMSMLPLPIIGFILPGFFKRLKSKQLERQQLFGTLSSTAQEGIWGISVVKAFVQENNLLKRFLKINSHNKRLGVKMSIMFGWLRSSFRIVSTVSIIIVVMLGGYMVIVNTITLGDFIAFNMYLGQMFAVVYNVGLIANLFSTGTASCIRYKKIFSMEPETQCRVEKSFVPITGNIQFNNVTFHYPSMSGHALKNISFEIKKGQTLGVIGTIGCGKTTMVNLLLRIFDLENGRISIDGYDIKDIPLNVIRSSIGYVPQNTFLFSASIQENIAFAVDDAAMDDIIEAGKIAGIHEEIVAFKEGMKTIVGEKGIRLSGGQKQRIAIARAIIKKPAILILDDALSAVDTITEGRIVRNIKYHRRDKTNIIITHRISSIKDADKILVMDYGMIADMGSHKDLMKRKGLYNKIYLKQQMEDVEKGDISYG